MRTLRERGDVASFSIAAPTATPAKAGQPGWAAITRCTTSTCIAGKPGWWLVLYLIPFVNFIITILVSIALANSFGKGAGFGIGLAFLGFIFFPIVAFVSATYAGPGGGARAPAA